MKIDHGSSNVIQRNLVTTLDHSLNRPSRSNLAGHIAAAESNKEGEAGGQREEDGGNPKIHNRCVNTKLGNGN